MLPAALEAALVAPFAGCRPAGEGLKLRYRVPTADVVTPVTDVERTFEEWGLTPLQS